MKNILVLTFAITLLLTTALLARLSGANNFVQEGKASYYGREFEGRKTASGEIFRNADFTCANKKLKFGTILRVTNQKNSLTAIVKVNDRGPFVKNRIIDLSETAARTIGIYQHGLATVKIESLEIIKMTHKLDSTFSCNDILDNLGNPTKLSGYSISLWRTKNLVHLLYIANELYLKEEIEKVYIVGLGSGDQRIYHLVISDLPTKESAAKAIDFYERQGFMIVKMLSNYY